MDGDAKDGVYLSRETNMDRTVYRKPRAFSLGSYVLIVFGLSWPFQIAALVQGGGVLPNFVLTSASMMMAGLASFFAGRCDYGVDFSTAGWKRGRAGHHLAALGFASLLWLFPALVRLAAGLAGPGDIERGRIVWLFVLPLVYLIPGFGEEFGWQGFLLPRLAARMNARRAVLVHAVVWWAWHLPLLAGPAVISFASGARAVDVPSVISSAVTVLGGAVPSVMHGVVFAYIRVRSESLAVATVYHAAYDGMRDSVRLVAGVPQMAEAWVAVLLTAAGTFFLMKDKWKKLEGKAASLE